LPAAAGIAGRHAAREYSGKILQAGIEDDKRNFTRFCPRSGSRKPS
jgi:prephenate dehydratase